MSKGKPTADFSVDYGVNNGVLEVHITADATVDDYDDTFAHVRGTTELSNLIKVIGRDATPITAAERKYAANLSFFMDTLGMSEDEAVKLAQAQLEAISNA